MNAYAGRRGVILVATFGVGLFTVGYSCKKSAYNQHLKHGVKIVSYKETPQKLITDGIYAHSRNPLCLGDFLIELGAGLAFGSLFTHLAMVYKEFLLRKPLLSVKYIRSARKFGIVLGFMPFFSTFFFQGRKVLTEKVPFEESHLEETFGEEYISYRNGTPKWLIYQDYYEPLPWLVEEREQRRKEREQQMAALKEAEATSEETVSTAPL